MIDPQTIAFDVPGFTNAPVPIYIPLTAPGVGSSQSLTQTASFQPGDVKTSFPTGGDLVEFNRLLVEDFYGPNLINPSGDQLGLSVGGFFQTLFTVGTQLLGGDLNAQQADLLQEYLGRADIASGIAGDPLSYISAELGAPENITTTYVGAASVSGTTDPWNTQFPGKVAISATFDYLSVDNAGKAWIGAGAKVNQNPAYAPPTDVLSSLNLLDPTTLAHKLVAQAGQPTSTTDPVSFYLWNSLTRAQQATLQSASSTPAQITSTLVAGLNAVITDGKALNTQADFTNITLSDATKALMAVNNPTAEQLETLNHLLLIDAYSALITDQSVSVQSDDAVNAINAGGITALPFGLIGAASSLFGGTFGANLHSQGAGIGATVVYLSLGNSGDAYIADGALVNSATDVTVATNTTGLVINFTFQGGEAHSWGVEGGAAYTNFTNHGYAYIAASAMVDAGRNVAVTSDYSLLGVTFTRASSGGASLAVGASLGWNIFTNDTRAFIATPAGDSSNLPAGMVSAAGDVTVEATTSEIVASFTSAGTAATGGSHAHAEGTSGETSSGENAGDGSGLESGDEGGASGPGTDNGAFSNIDSSGAGNDVTDGESIAGMLTDETGDTPTEPNGEEAPAEDAEQHGGVGISGAVSINDLHNDATEAYIANGVTVVAGGTLSLNATATLLDITIAGGSSKATADPKNKTSGDGSALAGSFAWDDLGADSNGNERIVEAYANGVTLHATNLSVTASNTANLFTFAVGGALAGGSGNVALIGSVGLDQLDFNTLAALESTADTAGDGVTPATVTIKAGSSIFLVSAAGGAAYTGEYGIGAGADVEIVHDTVKALIGTGSDIEPTGNVEIAASGNETVISVAAQLAIAKKNLGLVGAAAVDFLDPTVEAYVDSRATVKTNGNLLIDATDTNMMIVVGGSGAFGKNLGIGASVGYGQLTLVVKAYVGSGATIVAKGDGAQVANAGNTISGNGVLVNAAATENLYVFGAGGVGSERVSVAGSAAVANINNDVEAYIAPGATVNSGVTGLAPAQGVTLQANAGISVLSVAGAIGVAINPGPSSDQDAEDGSTAGSSTSSNAVTVGLAAAVTLITNRVHAYIGYLDDGSALPTTPTATTVDAAGAVSLEAKANTGILTFAIGGSLAAASAGGGGGGGNAVGLAGAGTGNTITNSVEAYLRGAVTVDAGGAFGLSAADTSKVVANAGGVGIGVILGQQGSTGVSAGVGLAYNNITNTVLCFIQDSGVTAGTTAALKATEAASIWALTVGGAVAAAQSEGGGATTVALAGADSLNTVDDTVKSYVLDSNTNGASNGLTAQDGAVTMMASDASTITANGGGLGIAVSDSSGGTAVGATVGESAALNTVTDTVYATIDNSDVSATNGDIGLSASGMSKIWALTVGGSIGVGVSSQSAGAGAAAGAGSGNGVTDDVEAAIEDSSTATTITSGDVTLSAMDGSSIQAFAGGLGIAVGASGGSTGVGVSIGVAAAKNTVNSTVKAFVANSTVNSAGGVSATATEAASVVAWTIGGAVAVGASTGGNGVGVAAAGAASDNSITDDVEAYVDAATSTGLTANDGPVLISATDSSQITANAGGVGVAVGAGSSNGVGVTVGFSAAVNTITNTVEAWISGSAVTAQAPSGTSHEVDLSATEAATVNALTIGGAVGVGGGGSNGVGVGAAGAGSGNTITNHIEAFIDNSSTVTTDQTGGGVIPIITPNPPSAACSSGQARGPPGADGDVYLSATDCATIVANGGGLGIGVGGGGSNGVGASLGVAAAVNSVTDTTESFIDSSGVSAAGNVALSAVESATINTLTIGGAIAAGGGGGVGVAGAAAGAGSGNTIDNTVLAYIHDPAGVTSGTSALNGSLWLTAENAAQITTDAGGVAVAGSGGGTGGGAATLGVSVATNTITDTVKAYVDSAPIQTAATLELSAQDTPTIGVLAISGAISGSGGGTGGAALAIGTTVALNHISDDVEAYLTGIDNHLHPAGGLVSLTAARNATITAVVVAASVAVSGGGTAGVSVAGGGAGATNVILGDTEAYVTNSVVSTSGAVTLTASDSSSITATVAAVAVSGAGGGTGGVAAGIGASLAENLIGFDTDGSMRRDEVLAYVQDSSIHAGGAVMATATAGETINAIVVAASAAISGGGTVGVSLSGSGVGTVNEMATDVKAYIDGDSAPGATTTGIAGTSISLTAQDTSSITVVAGAASIAASVAGTAGVALSIGVALAQNRVANDVEAYIADVANTADTANATAGGITLEADEGATIEATSAAASLAVGIGGTAGVSVSGAGAAALNTILTADEAYVLDSTLVGDGAVSATAHDSASITATIVAASAAVGGGGTAGVGASLGVALARNFIGWDPTLVSADTDL